MYAERVRHLNLWLGVACDAIQELQGIYETIIPRITHDSEVMQGIRVLQPIASSAFKRLGKFVDKYQGDERHGSSIAKRIQDEIFSPETNQSSTNAYETLTVLVALNTYFGTIEGYLTALIPASQALWDLEFCDALTEASNDISRSQAWVKHQISVRAPQTLIVPA